jgi:AAA domain
LIRALPANIEAKNGCQENTPAHFVLTMNDEAKNFITQNFQSLEMACWIALLQSKKAILAGDHLQLPPTIMSVEAAGKGLGLTLMERAIEILGKDVVRMLNIQYRMNNGKKGFCAFILFLCPFHLGPVFKNFLLL